MDADDSIRGSGLAPGREAREREVPQGRGPLVSALVEESLIVPVRSSRCRCTLAVAWTSCRSHGSALFVSWFLGLLTLPLFAHHTPLCVPSRLAFGSIAYNKSYLFSR